MKPLTACHLPPTEKVPSFLPFALALRWRIRSIRHGNPQDRSSSAAGTSSRPQAAFVVRCEREGTELMAGRICDFYYHTSTVVTLKSYCRLMRSAYYDSSSCATRMEPSHGVATITKQGADGVKATVQGSIQC